MVFTSYTYLLAFFPVMAFLFFRLGKVSRPLSIYTLIVGSLFFYACWNIADLPILLVSMLFNFGMGGLIGRHRGKRKALMVFAVGMNLLLLGYFKYTAFIINIFNEFAGLPLVTADPLPLAISFFTFQQIAWLADKYHAETPRCKPSEYFCAVAYFPHLIAGPIVQYRELLPQLQDPGLTRINWNNMAKGATLIAFGVFKKIVMADTLAVYASRGFDGAEALTMIPAWVATLCYTFQIYFDFSGYCDIAIGSSLIMNIRLPDNFHSPYKSRSVQEFWRRWHITLGAFLTKYVFIPLGGSREGFRRTLLNTMIVMFLSGIWHGAGYGFIIWGVAHGLAMVFQRIWNRAGRELPVGVSLVMTFLFVSLAWVLFRAHTLDSAMSMYASLSGMNGLVLPRNWAGWFPLDGFSFGKVLEPLMEPGESSRTCVRMLLLAFVVTFAGREILPLWEKLEQRPRPGLFYALSFAGGALLLSALLKMAIQPYTEFIYFNF